MDPQSVTQWFNLRKVVLEFKSNIAFRLYNYLISVLLKTVTFGIFFLAVAADIVSLDFLSTEEIIFILGSYIYDISALRSLYQSLAAQDETVIQIKYLSDIRNYLTELLS